MAGSGDGGRGGAEAGPLGMLRHAAGLFFFAAASPRLALRNAFVWCSGRSVLGCTALSGALRSFPRWLLLLRSKVLSRREIYAPEATRRTSGAASDAADERGDTPLHLAAFKGHRLTDIGSRTPVDHRARRNPPDLRFAIATMTFPALPHRPILGKQLGIVV